MFLFMGWLAALAFSAQAPFYRTSISAEAQAATAAADDPESLLQAYDQAMFAKHYDDALATAKRMAPNNAEGEAFIDALKASALLGLKRDSDARALIDKAEQLAPSSADPSRVLFMGAMLTDRPELAAEALDRMIARAPDMVRELDPDIIGFFLTHEPKGQEIRNDDRRIALARIGYGGDDETGHYYAANGVDILVKRGDFSGAGDLLQSVNEPVPFENMLIQKRYAPLWPRLEELAGPHLARVRESSLRRSELEYSNAPENHRKLQVYANALRHSGRLDDAIALRSKLPSSPEAMASADEDMGWAINNVALALHEAGRGDEADQLFALLNDATMPQEHWRVSMKINRLELLVQDGKFDKALPLIEPTAKTEGSPYADQLVRRLRYCTLSSLGKKDEAAKYLPDMLKHAADAPAPTIDGLVCAGELEKAERVALDALQNPDENKRHAFEEDFVRHLQKNLLTSDDPSVWQGQWQQLRSRPAMQQAFDRLGRDMPPELLARKQATASARRGVE